MRLGASRFETALMRLLTMRDDAVEVGCRA